MNDQESNFELSDEFYSRTINQENLDLAFDATDDGEFETSREKKPDKNIFLVITLSYSLSISPNQLALDDSTSIRYFWKTLVPSAPSLQLLNVQFSFAEDLIEFQCRYSRRVNAESQVSVGSFKQPLAGQGVLDYSMDRLNSLGNRFF